MNYRLDGLRFPVLRSRGRRHPEPPHPFRNEFQRDRDRVVHSRAFRRLEDKTQVFAPGLSDHFRNRLTHTLEVSQLARTISCTLGLDEDLTEALSLAHDLGHPPFGHSGEDALDRAMRASGERFDHNLHALRLVDRFEQRYASFPGLNLTFEVREGIVKHSRDYEPGEAPELDEYLPGLRPPLEAQLIDLADEIAYNTADLDDALAAGLFAVDEMAATVPGYAAFATAVNARHPTAPARIQFQECLRGMIDDLVRGLIEGISDAVHAAGVKNVEDVRRHPARLATFSEPARATNATLKAFLHARVYSSPELVAERQRSAAAVGRLFAWFQEQPERLPDLYRSEARRQPVGRVVCDYIAGMTNTYFWRVYRQAMGDLDGEVRSQRSSTT